MHPLTHPPPCQSAVQPGLLPVPSQLFQGSLLLGSLAKLGLGSGESASAVLWVTVPGNCSSPLPCSVAQLAFGVSAVGPV